MAYRNAKDILPKDLMDEVQKYIQGEYLYVPKAEGSRKKWGANSGYRRDLTIRNDAIRKKFRNGVTIDELVEEYCLSHSTVKKIVYVREARDRTNGHGGI